MENPKIARPPFNRSPQTTGKNLRTNERIRKSPIRLVGEDDKPPELVDTHVAIQRAKAAGLDLVEVAPNADPPVCRIMDYGKWKYSQKKKEQKARSHAKHSELKEVRLRPGTDDHDVEIKLNQSLRFLADGHKVQFTIIFKGRQMAHRELGFDLCRKVADQFAGKAYVEVAPRMMGRRMTMMICPGTKPGREIPVTPKLAPRPAAGAAAATTGAAAKPAPAVVQAVAPVAPVEVQPAAPASPV